MSKLILINADDFGISKDTNMAILKGLQEGSLTSTSLMANTDAFEHAVDEILPQIDDIKPGIHLNIIEGKSLLKKNRTSVLCTKDGDYNNGYFALWAKSNDPKFLEETEMEFRSQIEKILDKTTTANHIDSHVHTHAIPKIFELTCKLAEEYGIKYTRTQMEIPYLIPSVKKNLNLKYPLNLIKNGLLNSFTHQNKKTLQKYNLLTNDYFIGVSYTGFMDEKAIL
ncbi:MAG: ChbG/HpnK family deacetylase, partial [Candidatus Gastranaerophilales bacterium]|nr:ChbG/HpnK family deacetylase [Candidatus Gastranaerophilales bacterium]